MVAWEALTSIDTPRPSTNLIAKAALAWHHDDMAKKSKRPRDVNQLAHRLVELSTEEPEVSLPSKEQVSALMAHLGKKGGKIGGKRRMETMSSRERKAIATKAAQARWNKVK